MEQKYKVSKDIEKTSKVPIPIVIFALIFMLILIFIFWIVASQGGADEIWWWYVIWWIFILIPIWMLYYVFRTVKLSRSLKKHIENWTIISKEIEITKFDHYYSSDEDGTTEWYYIEGTDWSEIYKSKLFENAMLSWWYYRGSVDKDSLHSKWISQSPKLIYSWGSASIWDRVIVLIDPDNPKNYEIQL